MEAHQDALCAGVMVTQAGSKHDDEGCNTDFNAAHREIDMEDVEETDLAVLAAGDKEPDIEPKAEKHYRQ